jgi:glycosyltransferase involved in cell wall biosynthesis
LSGWQTLNLLSGAGLGAAWLYHTVAAWLGMPKIADLTRPEHAVPDASGLPRVSIIVPARNEAAMIEAAVGSLLALDYPDYEVVVVNDRSEDATGEILQRLQAGDPRLTVLDVRELPAGWLGKTHAMWRAGEIATGRWLLFSDADVVHTPPSLGRAVHYAVTERSDHLVLFPTMLMQSMGERMMTAFFQSLFVFANRPWKVRDPRARDCIGVGAFNLVTREAYEKIGTYESMRLCVVDDMRLAERVKRAGLCSRVAMGNGLVNIHWADGALGMVHNLTKNFFASLRYNPALALGACCAILWMNLGPWLGTALAPEWARAGYGLALGCVLAVYWELSQRIGISLGYVLLHPVACVLMVYALLLSTAVTLMRGGVMWRKTFYPLAELKKNG